MKQKMVNGFVYTSVSTLESRIKSSNQTEAFDLRDTLVRLSCRVGVLFGQLCQCQLMVVNQF